MEVVRIGLSHGFEAAIGVDKLPQRRCAGDALAVERGDESMQGRVIRDGRRLDQIEAAQQGQPGRRGAVREHRDQHKPAVSDMAFECRVVLDFLPGTDAFGSDQE